MSINDINSMNGLSQVEEDPTLTWKSAFEKRTFHLRTINAIAEEIKKALESDLDIKEIKEIVNELVDSGSFTLEEICVGKASDSIEMLVSIREIYNHSVELEKKAQKHPLEVKAVNFIKENGAKIIVALIASGVMLMGCHLGYTAVKDAAEVHEMAENVDINIGRIVATTNEELGLTLCDQCKGIKGSIEGIPVEYYDLDLMAEKIKKICLINPDLFDVTIANIYFDIDSARLHRMDSLFSKLKVEFQTEESLQEIFNNLQNYDTFLDYLMDKNLIKKDDGKYRDIFDIVEKYKILKENNKFDEIFNLLTSQEQVKLKKYLIGKYENYKKDQNYRWGVEIDKILNEILTEGVGTRGSES